MEKERLVLFRKILLENCISFFVSRQFSILIKDPFKSTRDTLRPIAIL